MKNPISKLLQRFFMLACLSLPGQVNADGVSIERASGRTKDSVYLVDAQIRYTLNDSVLEALTHAIQLHFEVTIEVRRERNWIWDKPIKTITLGYILQYQPLSNDYLVTDLTSGEIKTLQELDEALNLLGTINNFELIEKDALDQKDAYSCFIMSELKIRTLPLPLQPLAYISPKWHLASQWYEWTIR